MPCQYCGGHDTIDHSHVVSDFVIRYLRDNSVRRAFLYSWHVKEFAPFMIVGPYLCANCDNVVFSNWENAFSLNVFRNPLGATYEWGAATTIRFLVSICFRYAVHSLVVDNNPAHPPLCVLFRDRARDVLNNPALLGQTLFLYPYVYQPITERCDLRPGINHFLTLGFNDRFRVAVDGLPNCYFIQLPGISLLFSESDLTATGVPGYDTLTCLRLNRVFNPAVANTHLLTLYSELLNEGVQLTMNHQTATNRWRRFIAPLDRLLHPNRMVYRVKDRDLKLLQWQNANCTG